MVEIKKTLGVLKARWPEITVIIALGTVSLFFRKLNLLTSGRKEFLPLAQVSVLFKGLCFIITVYTMLITVGFLRTFYLEGQKRQSLTTLFRAGKCFFWRLTKFALIYVPILFIFTWLTFLLIKPITGIETSFRETARVSPFTFQLCFSIAVLLLIKPALLIIPLMVVLDCPLFDSFKLLRQCELRRARELLMLFCIRMGVSLLWVLMPNIRTAATPFEYILIVSGTVLQGFIGLMVAVMGVMFVTSLDLVYDEHQRSLDSQGLIQP